jgi:hypothetical protein
MTITMSSENISMPSGNLGKEFRSTRNVLHNGAFRVNQRAGSSYTGAGQMNLDRWYCAFNLGGFSVSPQTSQPQVFPGYFYRSTVTSIASPTAGYYYWIASQQIEGFDLPPLNLGVTDSDQRHINVSFWVRSSMTGTPSVLIGVKNSSGTWYYSYRSFTISAANTWEFKSLAFRVDSGVSCPTPLIDQTFSFGIWFVGGIGSTYFNANENTFTTSVYAGTASTTNFGGVNGATFDLARVQVESGNIATPFEFVPIAYEIQRCQRYYQKSYPMNTAIQTNTFEGAHGYTWTAQRPNSSTAFSFWYTIQAQTKMRVPPTVTCFAPSGGSSGNFSVDRGSYYSYAANQNSISDSYFNIYCSNPPDIGKGTPEAWYGGYVHWRAACDASTE